MPWVSRDFQEDGLSWSPTNWKPLPTLPSALPLPCFAPLVTSLPSFPKVLVCGSLC